ncbi:hypothetical protein NVP1197A_27 [Vibrio phage 1.197.A._10N.286.54.F2]|nr:hypothetical protein NVP1197A_27 [Vibrio phage 1.197.A._10N.286.54.F2]
MSFENRVEDLDKIKSLNIGESYDFNIFQDGGAEVIKTSPSSYELYELKQYSGSAMYDRDFCEDSISDIVDEVYDKWT